jgi:hypothetical protein
MTPSALAIVPPLAGVHSYPDPNHSEELRRSGRIGQGGIRLAGSTAQLRTVLLGGLRISRSKAPEPAPRSRLVPLGILGLDLVLALAVFRFWRLSPSDTTLVGGGGEVPFYLWVLRWLPFALEHGHNPLVTGYMNAPEGVNLMWNTSLVLPALLLAPVTLTFGAVATYNTLLTLALALSAFTAYIAIRRFVPSHLAAFAGGLVYGFGPYMRAHSLGHVNLTLGAILVPVLLLLVHDVLVRQRRGALRDGALLGATAGAQLLISEELLTTTVLTATVVTVILAAGWWRAVPTRAPYAVRALIIAALLGLTVAAVPLWVQFTGPYRYQGPATNATWRLVTDPAGVVVPGPLQALKTQASDRFVKALPGNNAERDGYLGVPLVLVMVATAVAWWRRPVVRVAAMAALIMLVLSMGERLWWGGTRTGIRLPWAAMDELPLLDHVITSRLSLYTSLFAGGLLAWFLAHLAKGRPRPARAAVVAAVAGVALVPLVPVPSAVSQVRTPRFFAAGGVERILPDSVVLLVPFPNRSQTTPMRWQVEAGIRFKMPGGYFIGPGNDGRAFHGPKSSMTQTTLDRIARGRETPDMVRQRCGRIAAELKRWKVDAVVLGPGNWWEDGLREYLTLVLGPPSRIDDVWLWSDLNPATFCQGVER